MGALFATPELFAAYVKVAPDYDFPFLAVKVTDERCKLLPLLSPNDMLFDAVVIAPPNRQPADRKSFYLNSIKDIKPGLTYFIVHLAMTISSRAR